MRARLAILAAALLLSASPAAGQERLAPPGGRVQGARPIERLEELRFQRLQAALGLTDDQTLMLRRQVNANREAMRLALEREQAAVQALERALASDPVDEQALQRSLDAVDAERAEMERLRRDQMEGLSRILNPEQRAKFLLFNRRFDARLRELVEEHRGRAEGGRPGTPSDRRP
jgi:Spy/CpxP family protein refolding chaperone